MRVQDAAVAVTDASVRVDGHRLHYLSAGDPDDPVLLLLHGGIIDAARCSWGGVIQSLAADFRVIAPDLLGYGDSDCPDVAYTMDRHVGTIAGLIDDLELAPVTPVGLSMGGGIALGLALSRPALLDRLVLIDSWGLGETLSSGRLTYVLAKLPVLNRLSVALLARSRRLTRASLDGIVYDLDALSSEAVDCVYDLLQEPTAGVAYRSFRSHEVTREGYRTTYVDRLGEVTRPTLLLHGVHDEVFPVAWAERAADRMPDADLRVLDACAHWPPRERPGAVVDAVQSFVPAGE